ncbi:MAG: prolyl oligopeptidase family serine peptidase [Paludibaculum sp.]
MKLTMSCLPLVLFPLFPVSPLSGQIRASLPVELVDTLDGARFKIRVPANWNGTLLMYVQGTKVAAAAEPMVVPPVVPGSLPTLEDTLLARGYALAASEIGTVDMQAKESVEDTLALAAYFRGRIGDPKRIVVWGTSLGGAVSIKMIEDYPRAFDGAIATCAPAAGFARGMDRNLDFSVAYASAFGWPAEKWGPVGDLRDGLIFGVDVLPNANVPRADGTNRGGWEFIRLVLGISSEAFWATNPVFGQPGWLLNLFQATATRALVEGYAAGPFTQNLNHVYTLTSEERSYLVGLGVNPDELLARMNAMTNIHAAAFAREYVERYGGLRGLLRRPVLTVHNTADNVADVRHEGEYRTQVEWWGVTDRLAQAFVSSPGHCAFTSAQLLAALDAMEQWLETGTKPGAASFPESLRFDNAFVPARFPY